LSALVGLETCVRPEMFHCRCLWHLEFCIPANIDDGSTPIRHVQSDVAEMNRNILNWNGIVFDNLISGQAGQAHLSLIDTNVVNRRCRRCLCNNALLLDYWSVRQKLNHVRSVQLQNSHFRSLLHWKICSQPGRRPNPMQSTNVGQGARNRQRWVQNHLWGPKTKLAFPHLWIYTLTTVADILWSSICKCATLPFLNWKMA